MSENQATVVPISQVAEPSSIQTDQISSTPQPSDHLQCDTEYPHVSERAIHTSRENADIDADSAYHRHDSPHKASSTGNDVDPRQPNHAQADICAIAADGKSNSADGRGAEQEADSSKVDQNGEQMNGHASSPEEQPSQSADASSRDNAPNVDHRDNSLPDASPESLVIQSAAHEDALELDSADRAAPGPTGAAPLSTHSGDMEETLSSQQTENKLDEALGWKEEADATMAKLTDENVAEEPTQVRRKHVNEDIQSPKWSRHKRHFFILSSSGKPIYSRYGDESKLSSFMGVIQAIISFIEDDNDSIQSIVAGKHRFVFLLKEHIYLTVVSRAGDSESQLRHQLELMFSQIISILTQSQLNRIFSQRINFDLRRLLGGTEIFLDSLAHSMSSDFSFHLDSIRCLRLPADLRNSIGTVLQNCRTKEVLYALVIAKGKLVTLLRPKKHSIHPSAAFTVMILHLEFCITINIRHNVKDLLLVNNLIQNSSAFRTGESWSPVCFPGLDSSGYLYAHVSCLDEDHTIAGPPAASTGQTPQSTLDGESTMAGTSLSSLSSNKSIQETSSSSRPIIQSSHGIFLILLSTQRDKFFELSDCKKKIMAQLRLNDLLRSLHKAIPNDEYSIRDLGIPCLRHFVHKSRASVQLTSPCLVQPYLTKEGRQRLLRLYKTAFERTHIASRPLKIHFQASEHELMLAWISTDFELYAVFNPLTSKPAAVAGVNTLLKWLRREESSLFILKSPVY